MTKIQSNILIGLGTFIFGIPIAIGINMIIEYLFIIDNGNCYEYRFPKLSWLLDFFYDGYHYDTNLLNFILTFTLGFYTAYYLMKFSFYTFFRVSKSKNVTN